MDLHAIGCAELLNKMAVPGYRNTYALGIFARRVTVRSQQVRALNLHHALLSTGCISKGSKILVVGAGFAGLTTAAASARAGCQVTVLERSKSRLHLQRNCSRRYLHPHIYDWPRAGSTIPDANLPLLNWKAGMADEVVRQIDVQMERLISEGVREICGVGPVTILQNGTAMWKSGNVSSEEKFDALVLALGFGVEKSLSGSYWDDTSLDRERDDESGMKILISGRGDGALTDLIRACLLNFKHDEILKEYSTAPNIKKVEERVMEIEKALESEDSGFLSRSYQDKQLDLGLELKRRSWSVFWSPGSENMFTSMSSRLNRFIVSQLYHTGAFQPLLMHGTTADVVPLQVGGYKVTFSSGFSDNFDIVIQRHGPTSSFERDLPQVSNACSKMREQWKSSSLDWTDGILLEAQESTKSQGIEVPSDAQDTADVNLILEVGYRIANIADRETVIIVVGSGFWPELFDRRAAQVIQEAVNREGKTRFRRAFILSDAAWDDTKELHENPVIAVGGPESNQLTKQLKDDNQYQMETGVFGSWKRYSGVPRVALWGRGESPRRGVELTRRAVIKYIESPDGLRAFLQQCWT